MFKRNEKGQLIDNFLKLNLQFFAGEDDDSGDSGDSDDSGEEDSDSLDIDELMKDPKFKKQHQAKLKEQLNKRLKKFEGIDPKEYERLKNKEEKQKQSKDQEEEDEVSTLKSELSEKEKRIARAERAEKRAAVKEFAFDNSLDHKLFARLVQLDDVELDDEGNAENLDELREELEEEFPQYFGQKQEEEKTSQKQGSYKPGSRQKSNNGAKEADLYAEAQEYFKNKLRK